MEARAVSEAAMVRARHAFEHERERTLGEIARTELGVSPRTFRNWRRQWRWPPRAQCVAASQRVARRTALGIELAQAAVPLAALQAAVPPEDEGPADRAAIAARLARAVRAQLDGFAPADAADPERAARTLASLVKTLGAADALARQGEGRPHDDEPDDGAPRSLEELRQELARRLERLVQDEDLERDFSFPDPAGVGNPD
ncbi:MAG TPA: hypothetical protein VIL09_11465 [Microvirga sp.]|jgi:transposase-like protein